MSQVIHLLSLIADGKFHSDEQLGQALGLTRNDVRKNIKKLSACDVDIDKVQGQGYRLSEPFGSLTSDQIIERLNNRIQAWRKSST